MEVILTNDFCHKSKIYNFDPYNVSLAIATNIPVLLMSGFVHGHIYSFFCVSSSLTVIRMFLKSCSL